MNHLCYDSDSTSRRRIDHGAAVLSTFRARFCGNGLAVIVGLGLALETGCANTSQPSADGGAGQPPDQQNFPSSFPQNVARDASPNNLLEIPVVASILGVERPRPDRDTWRITIDKGSKDGIAVGMKASWEIQRNSVAACYLTAEEVHDHTATLAGKPPLSLGQYRVGDRVGSLIALGTGNRPADNRSNGDTNEKGVHIYRPLETASGNAGRHDDAAKVFDWTPGTELLCFAPDQPQDALKRYQSVLEKISNTPSLARMQAICHHNIGLAHAKLGQYEKAIESLGAALAIYGELPVTGPSKANCNVAISTALDAAVAKVSGDAADQTVLDLRQKVLAIYGRVPGTDREQAACLANIAASLISLRRFEEAVRKGEEGMALISKVLGTEREQAACLSNIGAALCNLHRNEEGIGKFQAALVLLSQVTDTEREQAACLKSLAWALANLERPNEAVNELQKALAMFEKLPESEDEKAFCLGFIKAIRDSQRQDAKQEPSP